MVDVELKNMGPNHPILFLVSTLAVGGSERKTVRIANTLSAHGWKATIAYLNEPHALRREISGEVDVVYLDRKGKFGIKALKKLVSYIKCKDVAVVCCINLYPLIYAYLAGKSLGVSRPAILATINTTEFIERKEELKMMIYAPLLRRFDRVIFGSIFQRDLWVRKYKLDRTEAACVYNGVDVSMFQQFDAEETKKRIRDDLGISAESFVVGSVGRFRKEKQYQMAIKASVELRCGQHMDVHCLLVGGGYEEQRLKDVIAELQCESYVHLIDAVDDVRPYLSAMDVFVLTSASETFSNSALEAMSMRLPVILPRVGGCPEMVRHGVTGFIYDMGNIEQLVEYLSLLGRDGKRRITMGREARGYVESDFKFDTMVDSYMKLFECPK